jgi:hypothetical protein
MCCNRDAGGRWGLFCSEEPQRLGLGLRLALIPLGADAVGLWLSALALSPSGCWGCGLWLWAGRLADLCCQSAVLCGLWRWAVWPPLVRARGCVAAGL